MGGGHLLLPSPLSPPPPHTPILPVMGYLRSEDERLDLIAAARAMREAGHDMHVIASEIGVPVSTLYRWAAEGGWRGQDLAQARVREVFARQARLNAAAPAAGSEASAEAGAGD